MDFYKEQENSKKKSALLLLIFIISICVVVFFVGMFFIAIDVFVYEEGTKSFNLTPSYILQNARLNVIISSFLSIFIVIVYGASKKFDELERGGYVIANELGGRLLFGESASSKEKTLINVADEMSLAAGVGSVPIYIIENKHINAFVAGTTYDNAVLSVTRGAVELLNRDELQGVIAHEFSHIFNGDMKLNNFASGCISGILYIFIIGTELFFPLQFTATKHFSGITPKDVLRIFVYPLTMSAGIALMLLGVVGVACAAFMQFALNRQREYLADASAVQFTRYPQGIANALKKIGMYGDTLNNLRAGCYEHIFFSSHSSPSVGKRIKKIEPHWDGEFIETRDKQDEIFSRKKIHPLTMSIKALTVAHILGQITNSGVINDRALKHAKEVLNSIPDNVKQNAQNPLGAEFIIYTLLLDKNHESRKLQCIAIAGKLFKDLKHQDTAVKMLMDMYESIGFLEPVAYLDIIHICASTLKNISANQYAVFRKQVNELILHDEHVSVFEWCVRYIVLYPLDMAFGLRKTPLDIHTHIGALKNELEILLSALSYIQFKDDANGRDIFERVKKQGGITALKYIPYSEFSPERFEKVVDEIQNSKPMVRRKILELCIFALNGDGEINNRDIAVIHALGEVLHLPLGAA